MSCQIGINSLFGANDYIKLLNSDIVAIEGPNILERLIGSDIKIPYAQVLRGRIQLKAGQIGYLMNHLGFGDNATFVAIIARYDTKSVNEEDNYLEFYYADNQGTIRYMDELMILTGNSTYRIPQLYFNNPNTSYNVQLDIMVAVIDDNYSFFPDTVNQTGLSFFGLQCNSTICNIQTFVTNESIVIYDSNSPRNALVYLILNDISSVKINNDLIIIDNMTIGKVFLQFISNSDAKQANSLISYVMQNAGVIIQSLNPIIDITPPIVYFYSNIGNTASGYTISYADGSDVPYNTGLTTSSMTFSTSISLLTYGTYHGTFSSITKTELNALIIDTVVDDRDGIIYLDDVDTTLYEYDGTITESICIVGTYSLYFNINDLAGNIINPMTYVLLSITT